MANRSPDPAAGWLLLTCASCRGKCRVRAAAAARGARCPHCGKSILPPRELAETRVQAGPAPEELADDREEETPPAEVKWDEQDLVLPRRPNPYWLMWWGVYGFPWYLQNLFRWFLYGLGLSMVALCLAVVHWVGEEGLAWQIALAFIKGAVWFLIWTGAFACDFFLATIQQTAAGYERVKAPDDSIKEKALNFLFVAWLVIYAAIPVGAVLFPLKQFVGTKIFGLGVLPAVVFVFPWMLLCGLTNGSSLNVWNRDVVVRMLRHPHVVLTLYLASALLFAPCVVLGYLTIGWLQYYLAAPAGFVWAACLMIYGRLLGRVGYIITDPELAEPRRKKLKKLPTAGRRL
jgi:hypothetical protein